MEITDEVRTRMSYVLERDVKSTDDYVADMAEALFLLTHAVRRHEHTIERLQNQINYLNGLTGPY